MAEHAYAHRVTCQEIVELVTEYLDGSLSAADTALFEEHLNFCDPCVFYVDEIRSTIATVGRIAEEEVPPGTRDQLLAAFRDWRHA
jgi:anti-sigma factor RsiW